MLLRAAFREDLARIERLLFHSTSSLLFVILLVAYFLNARVIAAEIFSLITVADFEMVLVVVTAVLAALAPKNAGKLIYLTRTKASGRGIVVARLLATRLTALRYLIYASLLLLPLFIGPLSAHEIFRTVISCVLVLVVSGLSLSFGRIATWVSMLASAILVILVPADLKAASLIVLCLSLLVAAMRKEMNPARLEFRTSGKSRIENFRLKLLLRYFVATPSFWLITGLVIYFGIATPVYSYQLSENLVFGLALSTVLYGIVFRDSCQTASKAMLTKGIPSFWSWYSSYALSFVLFLTVLNAILVLVFLRGSNFLPTFIAAEFCIVWTSLLDILPREDSFAVLFMKVFAYLGLCVLQFSVVSSAMALALSGVVFVPVVVLVSRWRYYGKVSDLALS